MQVRKERGTSMERLTLRDKAQHITRFVTIQFIALVGWIIVQSFFSLSPLGRTLPFMLTIIVEAIWWIATLAIMFLLFQREYRRFVQSASELEEANSRLRRVTNQMLLNLQEQRVREKSEH